MRLAKHFITLTTHFINSIIQEQVIRMLGSFLSLSYDIKITLKSHFWRENVRFLSLCVQRCFGHY